MMANYKKQTQLIFKIWVSKGAKVFIKFVLQITKWFTSLSEPNPSLFNLHETLNGALRSIGLGDGYKGT